ncbi:hypothetical protein [Novosphingobium sp. KN65.2]|uniref:hypothetical protein n=1 Tax=Novosphingobium sp. KN65.2 TaxID=1478134 RepID=UPI0005E927AC|nr:hypothetical protein [Novosphingobium sp. KN65.2]CDO37130.1 hypothetical protein SPHV1_290003 [Novosphingobium sp. KN65.2]
MSDFASALVVFFAGTLAGIEWHKRFRQKSLTEKFGEVIHARLLSVYEQRKWVGGTSGIEISNTMDLEMPDGRKLQVIVRDAVGGE